MPTDVQTFTNYALLCKVPTEDDKLYYWENFQKLIPLLDPIMERFATTKVISWQHFERTRWNAKDATLHVSSSEAPTGGSNNSWTRECPAPPPTTPAKPACPPGTGRRSPSPRD
mgnify:CR=1 FL=1